MQGFAGLFLASYASVEAMVQFRPARNWVAISPTCARMLVLAAAAAGGDLRCSWRPVLASSGR